MGMKPWTARYQLGDGKRRHLDRYDVTPYRRGGSADCGVELTAYHGTDAGPILYLTLPADAARLLHAALGEALATLDDKGSL